jgi:NADH-quinone oxidoreductase subunit N
MFSMAGIPPTVGFYAKFAVLMAVVDIGLYWLAIYAVIISVVGAFYYLRIVKLMYFDAPVEEAALPHARDMQVALSLNGVAIIALGIFPGWLMALAIRVVGVSG